jgi:hypothetical protein
MGKPNERAAALVGHLASQLRAGMPRCPDDRRPSLRKALSQLSTIRRKVLTCRSDGAESWRLVTQAIRIAVDYLKEDA